ncbi:hypothetical protein E2320_006749 [Naja naja]|nr:hypothetical protein E2320_006749 [Naja naja]
MLKENSTETLLPPPAKLFFFPPACPGGLHFAHDAPGIELSFFIRTVWKKNKATKTHLRAGATSVLDTITGLGAEVCAEIHFIDRCNLKGNICTPLQLAPSGSSLASFGASQNECERARLTTVCPRKNMHEERPKKAGCPHLQGLLPRIGGIQTWFSHQMRRAVQLKTQSGGCFPEHHNCLCQCPGNASGKPTSWNWPPADHVTWNRVWPPGATCLHSWDQRLQDKCLHFCRSQPSLQEAQGGGGPTMQYPHQQLRGKRCRVSPTSARASVGACRNRMPCLDPRRKQLHPTQWRKLEETLPQSRAEPAFPQEAMPPSMSQVQNKLQGPL